MTWESVPLGEIAALNPRDRPISRKTTFLGMADLGEDGRTTQGTAIEPGELKPGYTPFRNDDLLVAKITPCFENGKIGQASIATDSGWGSTEFHVVRPDDALVDRRYLLHFLRSPRVRATGEMRMTGSAGQKRVPIEFLRKLTVPLPPLPEQRRIAAILDEADALRRARLRSMGSMTELPARIFAAFDTHDWHEATVGEIAELQGGLTINRRREALPLKASYLRVANVLRGAIDTTELKSLGVTETELARTRIQIGDVLMVEGHGNASEVGRAAFVENLPTPSLTHQNHLFRLRPQGDRVLGRFLELALNSSHAREYLRRASNTTSGLNTLSATNVRALPLRIAPLEIQHEIVAMVDQVRASEHRAVRTSAELDALFASLRHRAFRGEL